MSVDEGVVAVLDSLNPTQFASPTVGCVIAYYRPRILQWGSAMSDDETLEQAAGSAQDQAEEEAKKETWGALDVVSEVAGVAGDVLVEGALDLAGSVLKGTQEAGGAALQAAASAGSSILEGVAQAGTAVAEHAPAVAEAAVETAVEVVGNIISGIADS